MLNNDYILVLVALFCLTSVHSRQVCEVSHSKLGEGYNIMTAEKCGEYCGLVPQCHHWTWYRHHCPAGHCTEEDFVKQNICYALTDCRLVEEQCSEEECQSGHKSVAEVRIGCSQESELLRLFSSRTWLSQNQNTNPRSRWESPRSNRSSDRNYYEYKFENRVLLLESTHCR